MEHKMMSKRSLLQKFRSDPMSGMLFLMSCQLLLFSGVFYLLSVLVI